VDLQNQLPPEQRQSPPIASFRQIAHPKQHPEKGSKRGHPESANQNTKGTKGSDNEFKKTSTIKKNSNIPFQSSNLKASVTYTERSERSEQLAIPVFRFGSEPALLENGNCIINLCGV